MAGWQIDPNIKGYINGAVALCGVIATVGVSAFPGYIPSEWAKDTVETAGFIFMIYGGLNSAGNFLSSSKPGALAPQDPHVVRAATAVANLPANAPEWSPEVKAAKAAATQAIQDHKP